MANRLHHVIVPVTDMDRSLHLFEGLLGFTLIVRLPRVGGKTMSKALGIPGMEAEMAYLQAPGRGTAVELIRFLDGGPAGDGKSDRVGPFGLSLAVEDLDGLHERLNREGWPPLSEPVRMPGPDGNPLRLFCIRTEEGLTLELVEQKNEGLS